MRLLMNDICGINVAWPALTGRGTIVAFSEGVALG